MNIAIVTDRATDINDLHRGILIELRSSLCHAVDIGRMLSAQKEEMRHGDFLPWLAANIEFSRQTAERYMKLHAHSDEVLTVSNLSQAYAMVETLEAQEKRAQKQAIQEKIDEHRAAGTKPLKKNGRRVYDEFRKQEATEAYEERKAEAFEPPDIGHSDVSKESIDQVLNDTRHVIVEQEKHRHLSLSTYAENSDQAVMFTAIEGYINRFEDTSRQLEATHNLIKKLKHVANKLQQETV